MLSEQGVQEFSGDWDDYRSALRPEPEKGSGPTESSAPAQNDYAAARERRSALNRARGELSRVEARIAGAEAEIARRETELASPQIASDYQRAGRLAAELEEKKGELDELYEQWERAERQLASLTEEA